MSDITGNGNVIMAEIQLSPPFQDGAEGKAYARAMAYRDRILEAAGRSKETS